MDIDEDVVTDRWENTEKGERVRAWSEALPEDDPRGCGTHETIALCAHRRYRLGDKQFADRASVEARKEEIEAGGGVMRPLYLYDHGGLAVSTSAFQCRWDSGQLGWIGMEADKLAERGLENADEAQIEEIIDAEVEIWNTYLSGAVYAFARSAVEVCSHGHNHETEIERGHGFFGHDHAKSGLLEAAGIGTGPGDGTGARLDAPWRAVERWSSPQR